MAEDDRVAGNGKQRGWYADPAGSGGLRWWDGDAWTQETRSAFGEPMPPGAVPPMASGPASSFAPAGYAPSAGALRLEDERKSGNFLKRVLPLGVLGYSVSVFVSAYTFNTAMKNFDNAMKASARGTTSSTALSGSQLTASLISQLASFVVMGVGVVFLVWFYRALVNAQAVGLPLRRSPGWGVAGFIIPIVNYWFPYQSGCDLFPLDHPGRRIVGRWWAFWLTAQLSTVAVLFASFASVGLAMVLAAGVVLLYIGAYFHAREMIDAAMAVHDELAVSGVPPWQVFDPNRLGRLSGTGGSYPSAPPTGEAPPKGDDGTRLDGPDGSGDSDPWRRP